MFRKALVIAWVVSALVLASCSHTGSKDAKIAVADQPGSHSVSANSLDFTAKTVEGSDFTGASLAGKPVVLWFWAPWCPTCQREAPEVEAKVSAFPAISFVGVAARDSRAAMHEFVDKYSLTFPQLADVDGLVWARFAIVRQPAFVFIDRDGRVEVTRGIMNGDQLDKKLETLAGGHR